MKRTSFKNQIAVFLLTCTTIGFAYAQTGNIAEKSSMSNKQESTNGKNSFDAPYPFTANELVEQLLKVLEQPEGSITKEEVEAIFGTSIPTYVYPPESTNVSKGKIYVTQTGVDWYFSLGLADFGKQQTAFSFSWRIPKSMDMYPAPPDGMCIDATIMMKKIEQRGWQLDSEGRYRDISEFINTYKKGEHGHLRLHFTKKTNCVVSLEMSFHAIRFF